MRSPIVSRLLSPWLRQSALLGALLVGLLTPSQAVAHDKGDEELPPPPVSMKVIAPSAKGHWLLRIDNQGAEPLRVAADIRLLSLAVRAPVKSKKGRAGRRGDWQRRATICEGPKTFGLGSHFPSHRELVLEPGASYVEQFDPRLLCFDDKAELLVPGAKVTPSYGWPAKKKWQKRMQTAPFVADAASRPRKYHPERRLTAPTIMLSHAPPAVPDPTQSPRWGSGRRGSADGSSKPGEPAQENAGGAAPDEASAKASGAGPSDGTSNGTDGPTAPGPSAEPSAKGADGSTKGGVGQDAKQPTAPVVPKPQPEREPIDELAAQLTLTTSRYADARRPTDIALSVTAHNTGQRPLFIALRDRMLSFSVRGPNGRVRCAPQSQGHAVPRDLFRLMHHGTSVRMGVMLAEVCPPGTFDRPGLYVARPVLHADASGRQYGLNAVTGKATTRNAAALQGKKDTPPAAATMIRVKRGRQRFYQRPPTAIPTRVLPR